MAVYDREPDEGDEQDIADEVSYADTGRPWGARIIRRPSHAATRKYLAANPLPKQKNRRTP